MTSPSSSELGNLVRLVPLSLDDLPFHPALGIQAQDSSSPAELTQVQDTHDSSRGRPSLSLFLTAVLSEAKSFIDSTLPATFEEASEKSSAPSISKVRILKRNVTSAELSNVPWSSSKLSRRVDEKLKAGGDGEAWFARTSLHPNRKEEGTADFEELDEAVRVEHNEHEREYTSNIFDSYRVLDWDRETSKLGQLETFEDIQMRVYEMAHKLPPPLNVRVFPVLVVSAKTGRFESIIVHIPIDIRKLPEAFYSNGRNLREGDNELKRKTPVLGAYTSIERTRLLPDENIEWTMAVASDAKGSLPMWAQKMGLPGAIAKDVGLVMQWVATRRKGGKES